MASNNLLGKIVTHIIFGDGIVVKTEENYISIQFHSPSNIKDFKYPDCFIKFLKAQPEDEHIIQLDLNQQKTSIKGTSHNALKDSASSYEHHHSKKILDFCNSYALALQKEISFLTPEKIKNVRLTNGHLISKTNNVYYYIFESETELYLPDGIDIMIKYNSKQCNGNIISCNDFTVTLISSNDLGSKPASINIKTDSTILLKKLIDRLEGSVKPSTSTIVHSLIYDRDSLFCNTPKTGQNTALQMSLKQPISFIWGPPGTGKTTTLSKIALAHIKKGHRILMLSHSNVSVDSATLSVRKNDPTYYPGKILRYGYPKSKQLISKGTLTTYNYIISKHPDLSDEKNQIEKEIQGMNFGQRASEKYLQLTKRLQSIKNKIETEEKIAINDAPFIATTVSKAILDKTIFQDSNFDVVIFDEASMAFVPQIIFAASLAKKHFICLGDFNQLPPIVQNNDDSILHDDIFTYCGIKQAVDLKKGHQWLCMLDTQYRMHPDIATFVSKEMYHNLLQSGADLKEKRKEIADRKPFRGKPINLVDLSGMMTVCQQTEDYSRINPLSALITIGIASKIAENNTIGIITPYTAQSRLLNAMARDIHKENPSLYDIKSATVHQFQGSEEDVIIFDSVDCYRQKHPGVLLTSKKKNYANRLFNVAMTRSKGKFIAVANTDYLKAKNFSSQLTFQKMISLCEKKNYVHNGKTLSSILKNVNDNYQYLDHKNGTVQFFKDLEHALSSIYIDIPQTIQNNNVFIEQLIAHLTHCKQKGIKVSIRTDNKSLLPSNLRELSKENTSVWNAISIIDKKIVWFGEPLSNAHFKSGTQILPTHYRPIIRFKGTNTAIALFNLLKMNETIDQSALGITEKADTFAQYIQSHCVCKTCGSKMKLRKKQRYFLGCSNYPKCKNTELISVDLIESYFTYVHKDGGMRCPQCNMSLEAKKGPYGVYVQCCGIANHRYKLDEI